MPADLIAFAAPSNPLGPHHDLLLANALAQAQALAFGRTVDELRAAGVPDELVAHKEMPGNRPSTFLLLERLTPFALGSLVALYEHVVFTQGSSGGSTRSTSGASSSARSSQASCEPVLAGDGDDRRARPVDGGSRRAHSRAPRRTLSVLELHEADGAFARLEEWLRGTRILRAGRRAPRRRPLPRLRPLRSRSGASGRLRRPSRARSRSSPAPSGSNRT